VVVLAVFLVSFVVFGVLGAMGVGAFSTWAEVTAWALAAMFVLTASAHFTRTREDLVKMVPDVFPARRLIVFVTGILEVAGAVGLLIPATREAAALCLAVLVVSMFPANVSAARRGVRIRGRPPTPLALRIPMQILFIGAALWVAFA
jgi:uncharacterized membrane protein